MKTTRREEGSSFWLGGDRCGEGFPNLNLKGNFREGWTRPKPQPGVPSPRGSAEVNSPGGACSVAAQIAARTGLFPRARSWWFV